nr:hypothetical protein [Tanacetum cinerariifolium]
MFEIRDIVDLIGDKDPTNEDGDTEVSVSLGEISLEGKKSWESDIGDSDNTGDRVLGQMTYPVASLTLDSARSYVMQCASFTQGTVSSIPIGDSISPKVIVVAIVGVVIVVAIIQSSGDIVDLIGDEDPTDEDGDTELSVYLGEISLEGKKSYESDIGDSDNTGDGGFLRIFLSKGLLIEIVYSGGRVEMKVMQVTLHYEFKEKFPREKVADNDVDSLLKQILNECGDDGVGTWEMVKMGKASYLKNKNKDSKEQTLPPPQPIPTQEEPKSPDSPLHALPSESLHHSHIWRMLKLLKALLKSKRLKKKKEIKEEEVAKIIEEGLPKNINDPENYIVPLKVNGTTPMNALENTKESVSVMPYKLYKVLGLGNACLSNDKVFLEDNTVARDYGMVRNVRIQIDFHAYLFNGKGIMTIDDEVMNHVYQVKKRSKVVIKEDLKKDEDWLNVFEVRHDEKGYPKYGPTLPPFLNIEDEIERALAMEAYFNPFKNIIVYKNMVDFFGSLPIQLKNKDWTPKGYCTYCKIEGDEVWHAKFEVTSPSGRKFTRGFNTIETKRELPGAVKSDNLKWNGLDEDAKDAYNKDNGAFKSHDIKRKEKEIEHPLFEKYFTRLNVNEEGFNHRRYWRFIGKKKSWDDPRPNATNIQDMFKRLVHKTRNTQVVFVGNKMHKAFPLQGESSHWQYKFLLPVEGVPTARRMEIPLPGVCTAMMKKLPVKDRWQAWIETLILGDIPTISSHSYCPNSQKKMDHQYPTLAKIPVLDTGKFEQWQFRIQQYLQLEHYALWEVIEFGDSYKVPENADTVDSRTGRTITPTTEDMQKKKTIELWAAILKTFGGNEATKKRKKNLLKQQYGNFKAEGTETLEQTFNRLQVIVSQLQFMDVDIEKDDLNQKFLTSLAPEWLIHTIVWRNRNDLDSMSLDDLYNHLKSGGGRGESVSGFEWQVIKFRDSYEVPASAATSGTASDGTGKKKGRTITLTAEDMQKRKNDLKSRTTLLLSLPDEHQLRFSKYKTAQELWAAILKTFGGNEATKKTKKNLLKQQYGNFKAEGSETLEQAFNRLGNKDVNTTSVSTASTNVPTASANIGVASISQDTACAYIASQSNGSQIKFEDINHIDEDDMEEMDIKWNMALLSMRADKFWKKTGKKISTQGTNVAGFDKSKAPKVLMAIDGVGWDWSYMANDEENHALIADEEAPTEFSLMAKTSAESEVFNNSLCSKASLAQVESRLAEHKDRELKYCEKIRVLEFKTESSTDYIENLRKELKLIKKDKEGLDTKLTGFQTASKDLDSLLESQRLDKNKEGLGYSVVPPPLAQIYSPPKKDMSWTGLPECADDTITNYSRPSPAIESTSDDAQNRNHSVTKTEASPSTISPKPFINFVKANDSPTKSKTDKVETAKKLPVKYAEQYRKPIKKPNARGNQRNWNNQKSHHLGPNFVMKKKACFNYGDFNHLAYDCRKRVKMGISRSQNNTHKSFTPRPAVYKPYRPPMRPMRSNMNAAWPNRTSFNKPAHSYTKRHQHTKISTGDMGKKENAVKAPSCWFWKPSHNLSNKGPNSNSVSVMFKKYTAVPRTTLMIKAIGTVAALGT